MRSRREFMQFVAASAGVFSAFPSFVAATARQQLTQDDLLSFDAKGQVTLLHVTDIHGQLKPVYFRPPSENFGVANFEGIPPHLVGQDFLNHFKNSAGISVCLCSYNGRLRSIGSAPMAVSVVLTESPPWLRPFEPSAAMNLCCY